MARRGGLMSDALKYELARELGVAEVVGREGWGSVSSRNCGNLVRLAIERAERSLAGQAGGPPAAPTGSPLPRR
ncbi:MAG: alpha/beta-type small acid-soluble spore protein [Firmicutes bacterium]|nr:alpha/beta-type small acid-soluble spore protein [Bacillota bacterium]